MEGWIKLHRKFLEWEWFDDDATLRLFLTILLMANHEDKNWRGITIERGQFLTSRNQLCKLTKLSEQKIRTCIDRLKSTNEITINPTNKYSIITVCNYDRYQIRESESNQQITSQSTNNQPTSNQPSNKNDKNINNTLPNAPARESDWTFISSVRRSVVENNPDMIANLKKENFRLEVEAKAGVVGMPKTEQDKFVRYWTEHRPGVEWVKAEYEVTFNLEDRMRGWMDRNQPRPQQTSKPAKSRMDTFEENMRFINDFFDGQQTSTPDEQ